jgi:uncharacterized protein
LAVGLVAAGHGERRLPDLAERQPAPWVEAHRTAVELAVATAREVPAVVAALTSLVSTITGMGVAVAVALLGSPAWPYPNSPHDELDAFAATALLSIAS